MVKLLQWCTRVAGIFALICGVLIGRVSYGWLPRVHTVLGIVVVAALVLIAVAGFFARLPPVLPIAGVFWAGATLYLGYAQFHLMTGAGHWMIEWAHALLGIGAIGLAEAIGARVSRQSV
jgi:uncharacterized membrane protein YobD (UPF0266 family)